MGRRRMAKCGRPDHPLALITNGEHLSPWCFATWSDDADIVIRYVDFPLVEPFL